MGVEVVSVIASGVVGVAAIVASLWSTFASNKHSRAQSEQELLSRIYIEILDAAQRGVASWEAQLYNLDIDDDFFSILERSKPKEMLPDERAHLSALAALYGGHRVRHAFDNWLERLDNVQEAWGFAVANASQSGDPEAPYDSADIERFRSRVGAHSESVNVLAEIMARHLNLRGPSS